MGVAANWCAQTVVQQTPKQTRRCGQLFHTLMFGNVLVLALLRNEFTIILIRDVVSTLGKLDKDGGLGETTALAKLIGSL